MYIKYKTQCEYATQTNSFPETSANIAMGHMLLKNDILWTTFMSQTVWCIGL